ncbi:hypothetical protein VIBC2010_02386 [Vibrio caribbeanicus ATCC BAA-2122]|uniref:Uncharacterized protein n=1 Tax=Vibrio caribbeanicus ATCC BAA-2122 TaxID=796620 RepID=E3BPV3_9VIBR|nr:hypothetical protein VIBC2010_02386 [Vibrio caribbeanicus ATCC BAA-2122]
MAFVLLKSLKAHRRIAPLNINVSLVPDPFPHTKNEKASANAEAKNMVGEERFDAAGLPDPGPCLTPNTNPISLKRKSPSKR